MIQKNQLKRQLADKQLAMIAICGSIATGLAIHQAGALGALIAYGPQ